MNILVTGAAGYIGSHICVELINAGYTVIGVDNLSNSNKSAIENIYNITGKEICFIPANILDTDMMITIMQQFNIDSVIHLAGFKSVEESIVNPLLYYNTNVCGTLSLLYAMEQSGVNKIIFSSSATIYSSNQIFPVNESALIEPINPYGNTKIICEKMIRDSNLSSISLRYFNPVGAHPSGLLGENPKNKPTNLMPIIVNSAYDNRELQIFGNDYETYDGTCIRDYIHVVDLAKAHIAALEKIKNKECKLALNIGTGIGISVLDAVKIFEKANGVVVPYVFSNRRSGDSAISFANTSLAELELNWSAQFHFYQMCKDAWNYKLKKENSNVSK